MSQIQPTRAAGYLLTSWALTSLGILILAVAAWDYSQAVQYDFLRLQVLIGWMAAGIGATACLGGAMIFVDRAVAERRRAWYARLALAAQQRALMLGQFITMALALLAAYLLIFGYPIPGPHWLDPRWTPSSAMAEGQD